MSSGVAAFFSRQEQQNLLVDNVRNNEPGLCEKLEEPNDHRRM
jgi:hypothetical protein